MKDLYIKIKYYLGKIVVLLMFGLFPIITHDALYDLNVTRFRIFILISTISFGIMVINEVIHAVTCKIKPNFKSVSTENILVSLFLIFSTISYFISNYKSEAFIGALSRYTGYLFIVGLCMIYFTVQRSYKFAKIDLYIICLSVVFINLLALLNFLSIDPLHFFVEMRISSKDNFISTLGNVDMFAAYTSIFTPIVITFFMLSKDRKETIFFGLVSCVSVVGIIVSNSDCAFIGLLILLLIIPYLLFNNKTDVYRYVLLLIIIGFANFIVALSICFRVGYARKFSNILGLFVNIKISAILLIILIIFWVLINKFKPYIMNEAILLFKRVYMFLVLSLFCVTAITFIYFSSINRNFELQGFLSYLRFNDTWGSIRGYIWINAFQSFEKLPLLHQLFGTGEATFRIFIEPVTTQINSYYFGRILDSAHNELLHYLITIGGFGVLTYISVIIYSVKKVFRNIEKPILIYAAGIAILSYIAQSIFNIAQPITTPLFFVLLGILNKKVYRK